MIKKLQLKFILLAMSALFVVLVIIISGINIINYNKITEQADEVLSVLCENNGAFPTKHDDRKKRLPKDMSPEIPYEARYFSIVINSESGNVMQAETSRIAALNSTEAIDYALTAANRNSNHGFVNNYRYIKYYEAKETRIIFLDCGRKMDSFWDFLLASVSVSFISYLMVFAIIAFFSNKIIRPVSESYEKQKRFITDAGHEIKTPLTIINADVDVLLMELGENEWLEDIQKQAKRLSSLTNDLVYLARMEEASDSAQIIDFPFSDIVSETAASFQALAQTQNKKFTCSIQPMLSLKGNEKAIRQLVNILLDNALKYSPVNGAVSLTLEKHNKSMLLSIYNTTEDAIPRESLPLLFDRFYRIDSSHNSQTGGHGIGLSVAKAIVKAHHGKIQAKTNGDRSLVITAIFPI